MSNRLFKFRRVSSKAVTQKLLQSAVSYDRSTSTTRVENAPICPYCVEGGNFKVMIGYGSPDTWYMCAKCGHLALPTNPSFKCTCAKCVELK